MPSNRRHDWRIRCARHNGQDVKPAENHGSKVDLETSGSDINTVHPIYIRRLLDEQRQKEEFDRLVQDLQRAVPPARAAGGMQGAMPGEPKRPVAMYKKPGQWPGLRVWRPEDGTALRRARS